MNLSFSSRCRLRSTALRTGVTLSICVLLVCGSARSQQTTPSLPLAPAPPQSATAHAPNSASAPSEPSPYRITGIVVDTVTKSPIANATLTVAAMNNGSRNRSSSRRFQNVSDFAITDSDGRFDLAVPSAGGWELTASARGYRTQPLDEHDGYSTAVIVTEAVPRFDVTFHIMPASVIQGFILDEAGEAVREANVALIYLPPSAPDDAHPRPRNREQQVTDDRGFYKFGAIAPGDYEIRVAAHPWYASSASNFNRIGGGFREEPPLSPEPDPLDVVYPIVWYPGVTDPATATPITLRGGDTQEADFRLLPISGSRLHVAGPNGDTSNALGGDHSARPQLPTIYLTRLLPDGTEDPQVMPTRMDDLGNADIPGLSPGTYLIHQQSASGNMAAFSTIQVGAGSPRTVDLSEGTPSATVTVKVDPAADQESLQISFRDLDTGYTSYAQRFQDGGRPEERRRNRAPEASASSDASVVRPDRTVSLPPGKYEVFLNGAGDIHLAGIEATGATAIGRTVTIGTGAAKLLLHAASGRGTVTGVVSFHGEPDPGAMVMLVPATLGNPAGLDVSSRDQSNSDGSFEMTGMLPGGYILIAIDHGWEINWRDPATLRRYLLHGVPLDIKAGSDIKKTIEAQAP